MKKIFLFFLAITLIQKLPAQTTSTVPAGIVYENRIDIPAANACKSSEAYLKKKIRAQLAEDYKDYTQLAVDFISFKGQNGYTDKNNANRIVYPYEVKLFVYTKRMVLKDGKEVTEVKTWKHESIFEYATKPKRKCEFYATKGSDVKLVSTELY